MSQSQSMSQSQRYSMDSSLLKDMIQILIRSLLHISSPARKRRCLFPRLIILTKAFYPPGTFVDYLLKKKYQRYLSPTHLRGYIKPTVCVIPSILLDQWVKDATSRGTSIMGITRPKIKSMRLWIYSFPSLLLPLPIPLTSNH